MTDPRPSTPETQAQPVAPAPPTAPPQAAPPPPAAPPAVPYATAEPVATAPAAPAVPTRRQRTGPEQTRRIMVFAFGIIQVLIALRIVLILVAARADNAIVATIMDASDYLVAPFRGILQANVIETGGGIVVDLAAIVALIGWTILELMLFWAIGLFKRETA